MKEALFGKTLSELILLTAEHGLPKYTARQIAKWLYQSNISSIQEMSNLSKNTRALLAERYNFGLNTFSNVQESVDGTKKYLFPVGKSRFIESAYIPDKERATLCVSSQVGCKMGCKFCMTGKQGFQAHLTAGQILNQVRSLPEKEKLTNIVFMGMGEPFDNLNEVMQSLEIFSADWGFAMSPRRITVSTIGVIPGIKKFLSSSEAHLALSLHSPFEEERKKLMPVENKYHLNDILDVIKSFDWGRQRRVSFEYIMFKGINDSTKHAKELLRLLSGLRCRVNLIRFHPSPGIDLETSSDTVIEEFMGYLNKKGLRTTLRASRGQDIFAACGLLSTKKMMEEI